MLPEACIGEQINAVTQLLQLPHELRHTRSLQNRSIPEGNPLVHHLVQTFRNPAAHDLCCLQIRQGASVHTRPFQREVHLPHQQRTIRFLHPEPFHKKGRVEAEEDVAHVENDISYHTRIFPFVAFSAITRIRPLVTVRMAESAAPEPTLFRTILV